MGAAAAKRRTFETIIGLVKKRNADFLLIAGDLLEHETASRSTAQWVIEQIRQIPKTCVLITPGNHDPLREDSFYKTLDWPSHVHIFGSDWEVLGYDEFSLRVFGKGFADYEEPESRFPPPLSRRREREGSCWFTGPTRPIVQIRPTSLCAIKTFSPWSWIMWPWAIYISPPFIDWTIIGVPGSVIRIPESVAGKRPESGR